ncbi:unnamed protein product [Sphagnum jensenii]|uniref:Uncharacterized protein n=1 Tax=Sphagnum jensenii TaxID=128206 RepID=A0ABP1BBT1_9BRYO
MEFFLERVVPGAGGTVTDKVGADDLISALNVPSEIKTICCSFLRSSMGPVWDEDTFKAIDAIDAIGKCQNLEKLTIVGGLELEYNPNLKHLMLPRSCYFLDSIADSLGSMLAKNSTLEHLDLRDFLMSPDGIEELLRPLTGAEGQLPVNTSLKHISVSSIDSRLSRVPEAVVAMLTSNKALTHLSLLAGYVFSEPSDVCMVLQSLRTNETLQTLDFVGCLSYFAWEEDVFVEMLELTQANPWLKSIELPKAKFGEVYIEALKAQLAANAIKRSGTNVENVADKALHNPMRPEFLDEIEVPQEILECRPSDSLENGLDNLEENQVTENTTSIAHDRSQFCLRNDVLGTSTSAVDPVTLDIDDLVSTLNMPCAFSAIDCNFQLAGSYSALDRTKRLKAIDAIGRCESLKRLTISGKLDFEQIHQLCKGLATSQVEYLELCISGLPDRGLTIILETLEVIPSLKHFKCIGETIQGYMRWPFESMLAENSTLEQLDLGDFWMTPHAIAGLLRPLTGAEGQLPLNTSLKHISLQSVSKPSFRDQVAEAMARMLSSNKVLIHLKLAGYVFSEPSDVCMVLQSLRTNETLQTLDFAGCLSHFAWDEDVFVEMLELTQANPWLKSIELPKAKFGEVYIEALKAQLAANAIKRSGTNVENVADKALHNPMRPEFLDEIEVPQEILECRPSDSLENGLDNLEENQVTENTTSIAHDRSQFCLRNDVLGTSTSAVDPVTLDIDDLVSTLNMPCAFSAIDCNFQLAGSYSALDRTKRLKAIDAIGRCKSLKRLTISGKLDFEQIHQLCKGLPTSHVEYLELCISGLPYSGWTTILETLVVIPSLKHFKCIGKTLQTYIDAPFESMLAENSTLEHLDLGDFLMSPYAVEALLRPLTGAEGQLPLNTSLKQISLPSVSEAHIGHEVAEAMARMLSSNKALIHLKLAGYVFSEPSDVCMVLQSLRTNETLQTLDFVGCLSHFAWEEDVFVAMLELTQANPWLKSIELSGTQLEEEQKEAVRAQLAANAKQRSEANVETVREKASIYPVTLQAPGEVEVLQEMLAIRPSDPLEVGMDNLEECNTLTINTFSSTNAQNNNMKSQVVDDRINMATTIQLSTTHILDLFHQACNSITKVLRIKQLPRIDQQTDVGVHDNSAILQVLEKTSQQNPRGIIVAARIQADDQQIQFLFADACGMASTVGVGLDFAIVYWTQSNEVFVEAIEKDEWLQLWTEAFTNGSSFHEPIIMHLPHDSNIITTKVDHIQTSEDICTDDVLGTLSACGEVLLLKLIVSFFMTREVFGKIAKSQNHDSSMTTKGSDSTLPSVVNDVEHEGFEYCNVVKKANMMGQTQLPKDLLGLLWNLVLKNGNTNGGGNGNGESNHGGGNGNGENNHGGGNGNGENNHGGGNDNNDDGDGEVDDVETPSPDLTLEGQCAIVNIIPRFGGYWVCSPDFVLGEDLKHAQIDPCLCFKFSRSKEGNKKILTRLSARFDLNNAIPKDHEEDRFGWFQTHLNVSLKSSDCLGVAKIQHGENVLGKLEALQTHIQRVNSQSNAGPLQFNIGFEGGVPVAKAKVGVSKSTKTKSLLTETVFEIPVEQIFGGFVPRNRTGPSPTPHLAYDFVFPSCPTDLNHINEEKRNWYLISGLCSTVTPMIEGTWDPLNEAVDSPYTFRASRRVCELTYESPSTRNQFITGILGMTKPKLPMTKRMQIEQVYELNLLVNHQMTHICNSQITLKENEKCDLMEVGKIEIAPSSSGSSSASANNV